MIVHTSLPLIIQIIDLYLLLAGIRLILSHIPAAGDAGRGLGRITDPVAEVVRNWVSSGRKPIPMWLSWLLVCIAGLMLRQLLILLILKTN